MRYFVLLFAAAMALSIGCDSTKPDAGDSLKFFGVTYANYQQVYKKAPSNWSEFLKLSDAPGLEDDMKQLLQVRESNYAVVWNVDCQAKDASKKVLAFPKTQEKAVLFADGSLRKLTPTEFAAMKSELSLGK